MHKIHCNGTNKTFFSPAQIKKFFRQLSHTLLHHPHSCQKNVHTNEKEIRNINFNIHSNINMCTQCSDFSSFKNPKKRTKNRSNLKSIKQIDSKTNKNKFISWIPPKKAPKVFQSNFKRFW